MAPSSSLSSAQREAREALLLAAFAGSVPSAMRLHAGPFADPPPVFVPRPGARIVEGKVEVTGKLPEVVVRRILRANFPRFRACYETGLRRDPGMKGTVGVQFIIDTKGEVEGASLKGGTLTDEGVRLCVLGVLRTLAFPEPETGKVVVKLSPEFRQD